MGTPCTHRVVVNGRLDRGEAFAQDGVLVGDSFGLGLSACLGLGKVLLATMVVLLVGRILPTQGIEHTVSERHQTRFQGCWSCVAVTLSMDGWTAASRSLNAAFS